MTASEFKAWTEFTEAGTHHWTLDEITRHNRGVYLFYIGGENGKFIQIEPNGLLSTGKYEGAIPHIGEACFATTFVKQFPSQDAALKRVMECGGVKFILDINGIRAFR